MAKIIGKTEFLALPANTLYRDYEGGTNIGKLQIKGDSLEVDFWVQDLDSTDTDDLEATIGMFRSGTVDFDLDCESRDAQYDESAQYLVYDYKDIEQLTCRLFACIGV